MGEVAFFESVEVVFGLPEGAVEIKAAGLVFDDEFALPEKVDVAAFAVGLLTGVSKVAMRRRVMPKTLKKASQKDFASASSEDSSFHSREKAVALARISFQDKGMLLL